MHGNMNVKCITHLQAEVPTLEFLNLKQECWLFCRDVRSFYTDIR